MLHRRRALVVGAQFVVVLVMLTSTLLGGAPAVPRTRVFPAHPPGVPQSSGSRFVPNLVAQQYPPGTWYSPHGMGGYQGYNSQSPASLFPQGRKPGEQPDLRTAASETFLNTNGTWTLKSYPFPIHYQDAQGNWQPIDNALTNDTSVAGYGYGNRANTWHVHFAPTSGGPQLVHAQFPGVTVKETLDGANAVSVQVNKNQALYAGVFPGVDLEYLVGTLRLEEMLLLHDASGPASYTFTYHLPGVTAEQDALGNVLFKDAQGTVILTIGNILMYEADAQGQMTAKGAVSQAVQVALSGSGPDFQLTLTPDQAWLKDAHRHFPVAIDPSWSWQGGDSHQNTTNGNIYADTIDESGNPNTLFYNLNALRIGKDGNGVSRAYLKFPIDPPPANVRVTSANLALYQSSQYTNGGVTIYANMILSPWNATTLDWNNHPTNLWGTASAASKTAPTMWTWVHFDMTQYTYNWWEAGFPLNGIELQYADENQAQEHFFSDDNTDTAHRPVLTINYVQDTTAPTGSVLFNGGVSSTNQNTVTVTPAASDAGAVNEWSSNWTTVNGTGAAGGYTAAATSVDGAHSQLIADTSSCGASQCWASTFFTHTLNINNWPTFTAMFKTDAVSGFHFGAVSKDNSNTRFDITAGSSSGFTTLEYSPSAGTFASASINVPISANTWYYGQVDFPLPNVGEIYIWPMGQPRPTTPTVSINNQYMTNPGLNFWQYGDNGANLHHYSIANVQMTSKDTSSSTVGYGVYGMQFSTDGTTYGCPAYSGSNTSFSGGAWCVYSAQSFSWTFPTGDSLKKLWYRYVDNAGNIVSGSSQLIYDTTPPSIGALNMNNNSEVRGVVSVAVRADDPTASDGSASGLASGVLYVDGVQAGTPVSGSRGCEFLWDTTNLPEGLHTLTVKLTDATGNSAIGGNTQVIVANSALMPYEMLSKRTLPDGQTTVSANTANGDAVVSHVDLDIPGRGPDLSISRTWHSLGQLSGYFGMGWSSEFDERLTLNADGSVSYRDAAGGQHVFLSDGSGGYIASPGLYLMLVKNGDGTFTILAKDQSKTNFSASGLLTSVLDRNGNTLSVAYSNGVPTTVTDAAGRQLTLTITAGHITRIDAPGSRTYGYAYDGTGNLTDYTDPSGVVTHYGYDSNHRLISITLNYQSGVSPDSQTNVATTLTYDTSNRLVKLVDPLGYDAGFSYGTNAYSMPTVTVQQLQTASPATYATTVYELDGVMGAVLQLTNPVGGNTLYMYDPNGNVTQVTDPDNHYTNFTYDANGNILSRAVGPGGSLNLTTSYTYDSANNVLTSTDPNGVVTQFTYDSPTTGNLIKVVQDYVSGGPQNSDTNVTATATYDTYGEVLTKTDPLHIVTQLTYDSYGNVLTTTANYVSGGPTDDHTNVQTSVTYDILGEPLTVTNPLGIVTSLGYDILGHVLLTVANYKAGGPTDQQTNVKTLFGYDALGRQVTVTKQNVIPQTPQNVVYNVVTQTTYDKDGRVTQTVRNYVSGGATNNDTNVLWSSMTYDAAGNVLVSKDAKTLSGDPTGNITTTTYDLDNRPIQVTVTDNATPTPHILQNNKTVYDLAGFTTETDLLDSSNTVLRKTTYTYDGAGRQATSTAPPALPGASGSAGLSNLTTFTYDANGNTLDAKTTNAAVTGVVNESQATFDKLNRPLTKTEQVGTKSAQTSTFTYDLDGRGTSFTDPANNITSATYDALGRVIIATQPDGSVQTMTYDAASQVLSSSTGAGTTKDAFDPLGRVLSEERDDAGGLMQTIITSSYDANGNKLSELTNFPGGTSTTYLWTYDKLDRPVTMSDGTRTYTYDLNGNVTAMTAGNALQATASYDGLNRTTQLVDKIGASGTTLHSYSYTYDAFGNRSQITDQGTNPTTSTTYSYDNLTELTKIQQGSTTTSFTYDANGNRHTMVTSAGTTTYTYDSADVELTIKQDPNGKVTNYNYDTNGNLTTAVYDPGSSPHLNQTTTYTYDTNNRLKGVTEPNGTTITFTYDADGNRNSKVVTSGSTSTTIKDVYALGHLAYQTDGSGNVLATFTYDTGGMPSSVVVGSPTSGPRYFYLYNGHGDVVALTDSTGAKVAEYSYDEFGVLNTSTSYEHFPGGWSNPYRYDGDEGVRYDSETGLYWMSVRAYDPTLGRFLSHDPLGRLAKLGMDLHPYVYVGNNPLTHTDPSGMMYGGGDEPPPERTPPPPGGSGTPQGGGPTVGGSPPTQQPTNSTDPNCSGLTNKQCTNGYGLWKNAIADAQKFVGVFEVGIGAVSFVFDLISLIDLIKSPGASFDKIVGIVGSALDVVTDLANVAVGLGHIFGSGFSEIGDIAVAITNALNGVRRAIQAIPGGFWATLLKGGVVLLWAGLHANVAGLFSMALGLLEDQLKKKFKIDWETAKKALVDLLQAGLASGQAIMDHLESETITEYCHSPGVQC